jgi:Mo-dependent nitrogenase C-terminus
MSNLQMVSPLRSRASEKSKPWLDALDSMLQPFREWLDAIEVNDADAARLLYKLIPGQCPFERDVMLFGRKLLHIPPLCKLNPFYDQLVGIRFRAMCFLVDECGETL